MIKGKFFWNNISKNYSSGRTNGRKFILDPAMMDTIGNIRNKQVLDIGCGDGAFTLRLAQKGAICTGIDFSDELIEIGKRKAKKHNLNVEFQVADATNIHDSGKRFDMVLITAVLHHIKSIADLNKIIASANILTTPKGKLLIGEPHPAFDSYMRNLLGTNNYNYFSSGLPYQFEMKINEKTLSSEAYHWILEDYISVLSNNGFVISKIIEPQVSFDAKMETKSNWFKQRSRFPSYIIFECIKLV